MSAQRSDGQVTVLIAMDRELRSRLEEAAPEKSRFIRTAIREKIERVLNYPPDSLAHLDEPPSRAGKGGKPTHAQHLIAAETFETPKISTDNPQPVRYGPQPKVKPKPKGK